MKNGHHKKITSLNIAPLVCLFAVLWLQGVYATDLKMSVESLKHKGIEPTESALSNVVRNSKSVVDKKDAMNVLASLGEHNRAMIKDVALRDSSILVRIEAARIVGDWDADFGKTTLRNALKEKDGNRYAELNSAVYLAELGDSAGVDVFMHYLKDSDPPLSSAAILMAPKFVSVCPGVTKRLVHLLESALQKTSNTNNVKAGEGEMEARWICKALIDIHDRTCIQPLEKLSESTSPFMKQVVADAIKALGADVKPQESHVDDDVTSKRTPEMVLKELGIASDPATLLDVARNSSLPRTRLLAIKILSRNAADNLPMFKTVAQNDVSASVRIAALEAIGDHDRSLSVKVLKEILANQADDMIAFQVATMLAGLDDASGVACIRKMLRSKNPLLRGQAINVVPGFVRFDSTLVDDLAACGAQLSEVVATGDGKVKSSVQMELGMIRGALSKMHYTNSEPRAIR